ncbi:MAG: WD40/YVTN/BNR-like repeat-containing protein [Nitrososphaerales archaeon]
MAHRLRPLPLSRLLLLLFLALPVLPVRSVQAQAVPAKWQPLGGPGGRLTHLVAGPEGKDFYAVSVVSVNRQGDQTQWRDAGTPAWSDALYGSRDAGASWKPVTNDLPPGEITALYVDRMGRVWVGIHGRDMPATRDGLWRSDDRGQTWRRVQLDRNDLVIRTITEDEGGRLLMGAVDAGGVEPGMIYSSPDGATWTGQRISVPTSSSSTQLARLIAHPTHAGVLFVVTPSGQLLRSIDAGVSWLPAAGTTPADTGSAQLVFLPDLPDVALFVQSHGQATRVMRSTDAGATWTEVSASGLPNGPLAIRSMLALPKGVLLVNTGAGTYRSANAGRDWQPLEGVLSSGFVRAWAAQGRDTQGVLAATDYGLFASNDSGAIWHVYGMGLPADSGITALLTHPDRPTQVGASLRAPGDGDPPELVLSRDGAHTWLPADGGGVWSEATAWAADPANPDNFYVAGQDYVAASKDGGFSWKVRPASNVARTAIAVAPSDSSRIYVDGAPILRSTDGGQTWAELPLQTHEGGVAVKTGLAVDPTDASHLWGGAADGVYETRDGGDSWQRSGLDGRGVRWLAASGGKNREPVTVYAGLVEGGIMRRRAATEDWQPADAGLPPGSAITAFVADPRTPGLLWATRDGGGVYRSGDGGDTWSNVGAGVGENLGLALAVDYQAPDGVLMGTATAGVWALGSGGPAPVATETPAGSPTSVPGSQGGRAGVDARIEVVWPHDFAPIDQAELANVGIRLFLPDSLQTPACAWRPKVQLWRAVDTEPAELVDTAEQRSVDGQPFPYWEVNDVDVSAARDGTRKIYYMVAVEGVDTATSVWAHASDARTYFPEQQVPSGIATGAVDAVDARIQIVWPHDAAGAERSVDQGDLANVAVTLFKHGTRLSVPLDWPGKVTLYGAWNAEVARPLSTQASAGARQSGVITYPVWEFNDVPVDRAKDATNKLYLWAMAQGIKSYPTVWAHGADARTYFPAQDEPIQGCLP